MYQYPNYLMHYGVPGMKWGQRRKAIVTSRLNRKAKKADRYQQKANAWKVEAKKNAMLLLERLGLLHMVESTLKSNMLKIMQNNFKNTPTIMQRLLIRI